MLTRIYWNSNILKLNIKEVQKLVDSIKLVRSCIMEGCPSGFNPTEGDWVERLFLSQAKKTYDALKSVEEI